MFPGMFPSDDFAHRANTLIVEKCEFVYSFFGKGPTFITIKKDI